VVAPAIQPPRNPPVANGVRLRRWRKDDVDRLVQCCTDPEIVRWTLVPARYTRSDAREFIKEAQHGWDRRLAATFCIADEHVDGLVLGAIGLSLRFPDIGHIGYWVAPDSRGRGVATTGLGLLCRWAFAEARFERLELQVMPGNEVSGRVAERVGFKREGVVRSAIVQRGRRFDGIQYSLLPGELTMPAADSSPSS
jgi:RimJ/RimL family protein N-acetyltransferase